MNLNPTKLVQICAFEKGKDTCGGDSGGPLTINYKLKLPLRGERGYYNGTGSVLVGVVSYGPTPCANNM